MRLLLTALSLSILQICFSQSSYVYKRNPATGQLEVYQSQGGLPTGSPIYKIKKNVYGYLEVENVDVSLNPFTRKPDYEAVSNYKPYQLPAKEIFETLETLNRRAEFDYVSTRPKQNTPQFDEELKRIQEIFQKENLIASAYLKFYSSNTSFPKTLKDGWYVVVNIFENKGTMKAIGVPSENGYNLGICKIENNKISEYYKNSNIYNLKTSFVFQKAKIEVSSAINSCKASFREDGIEGYSTIYFLDNILDSTKQIPNPNYSFYTIYTSPQINNTMNGGFYVQISRNKTITTDEVLNFTAGPYFSVFGYNPENNVCNNSVLTLSFKNIEDKFSISVLRLSDKKVWIINNITLYKGSCNSTILKQ